MFSVLHQGIEYPINHIQAMRRDLELNAAHDLNMIIVNRDNNPAYPYLQEESIIKIKGHEYRIKKVSEKAPYKNISALHTITDLVGIPFNQKLKGSYTPSELFSMLLNGTGWTAHFDSAGVDASIELVDWGRNNVWKLLLELCNKLRVQFEILPCKILNIKKSLSADYGRQFRYAYNLRNITKDSTSTDIVTHVIVNFDEELKQSETFVSPTAGNYDRQIYGDIINDERIKTSDAAYKRAKDKFRDIEISYDLDIAELGESYELGETIHTIYEPMNDLSIVTNILKIREEWDGEDLVATSVTVGNYVFKTAEEILQDQIKDTESNVNDNIEKTAEKTTEVIRKEYKLELSETVTDLEKNITTEYTAMISLTARELKTEMTQHVTTINNNMGSMEARFNSSISQTASQIRAEVSSEVTSINNNIYNVRQDVSNLSITANSIQSTVTSHTSSINGLNTQMSSAQSSITQMSNQITQKVSYTDYNGSTIISKINQDPYSVTIDAQKINLNGAVIVSGDISGATNINVSKNITVGETLHIGQSWTGNYNIKFGGEYGAMQIKAQDDMISLSANSGVKIPHGPLWIENNSAVTSSVVGMNLVWNGSQAGAGGRLYVRSYSSEIGYLELKK